MPRKRYELADDDRGRSLWELQRRYCNEPPEEIERQYWLPEKLAWEELAAATVARVCREQTPFTAEDVCRAMVQADPERARRVYSWRSLGPIMKAAEKTGLCQPTGRFVWSRLGTGNRHPVRVWRSLVLGEDHLSGTADA